MDFEHHLTRETSDLQPVEIRDVVDLVRGRDVISMAAGWPSPETFPIEQLGAHVEDGLSRSGSDMLQYGSTTGYPELRERLAERMAGRTSIELSAGNVLVTAGSQQALYLLSRAFVGDDTRVAVGAPTYVAALAAFRSYRSPEFLSVPLDGDGIDVDALAEAVRDDDPSLVYTVPTFQNPTGVSMSRRRRERLVDLSREHDFLIVEDQPYSELRFAGEPLPSLYSLAPDRTVYLGTFSKVLAPGFRLGWIIADEALIRKLELIKQPIDLHTNSFGQHVSTLYLESGVMDEQIGRIRDTYRERRDEALDALDAHAPPEVEWTRPEGGMFLWVTLPERYDAKRMLPDAVDNGVAYVPGAPFHANDAGHNTLRLNYTFADAGDVETGVERLARTILEHSPE